MKFTVKCSNAGMRLVSHIRLALHILSQHPMEPFSALSYIFGSIQPDICIRSYLAGVAPGDERRGHNYRTALMRISKLEEDIFHDGVASPYILGKITHYASDAFTWPHNPQLFHGSLKEHMKYERRLDDALQKRLFSDYDSGMTLSESIQSFIAELHAEYERNTPSAENDLSFIIPAAAALRTAFAFGTQEIPETVAGNVR